MPTPLQVWFSDLQRINTRVAELTHETSRDLKVFSKQTLGTLVPTALLQGNLCQFVQTLTGESCPDTIFGDPTKDFRWFLDTVTRGPVLERLIGACYSIAHSGDNMDAFRQRRVSNVFPSPAELARLDRELAEQINQAAFFPAGVGATTGGNVNAPIVDFCGKVMA